MKNAIKPGEKRESAGDMLRRWRQIKKISQMDLALDTDISTKHLSFVETGRAKPSRDLILKIAHAMKLPYRHRNAFLMAAGYAPEFHEEPFDGPSMDMVRDAIRRLLENHEPYPAFVVDTGYTILMKNSGYDQLVRFYAGDAALRTYGNAVRILFAEDGLKPYVKDWHTIEHFLLARIADEVLATQNAELLELYTDISARRSGSETPDFTMDRALPVMSLVLEKNSRQTAFFTTVATLGSPLDLTCQELRIELLFPSDEKTKQCFPLDMPHDEPV